MTNVAVAWALGQIMGMPWEYPTKFQTTLEGAPSVGGHWDSGLGGGFRHVYASSQPRQAHMDEDDGRNVAMEYDPAAKPIQVWRSNPHETFPAYGWANWHEIGAGFPFICFFMWLDPMYSDEIQGGIQLPDPYLNWSAAYPGLSMRGLPYLPIWPGLIANTAIYSTLWWGVLFAPGIVRRRRRRRRGLCIACGYDLAGGPTGGACPECGGTSVQTTASQTTAIHAAAPRD